MKKIILCISIIALRLCADAQIELYPCQNGQTIVPVENGTCNYNPFVCVFDDNFDGNKIDPFKWNPRVGVFRDYYHTAEQQWYNPENAIVSDGTLKLTAKIQPLVNQCFQAWINNSSQTLCQDFSYQSAEVDSRFQFGAGRFEIRCKLPKGKGFWPAFWTYGYGSVWSEIDVFEFANKYNVNGYLDLDKSVRQHGINTHYDWDGDGNSENCPTNWEGPDFSADFHTFAVVWTNHKVEWFVDGVLKKRKTLMISMLGQQVDCNGINAWQTYVADKSFPRVVPVNIIANLAIQSGNQGPSLTPFPSALEIDYIRYYKQLSCPGIVTYTNTSQLNLSPTYYNAVIGTTINMNTNVVLQSGQQLTAVARDKIVLGTGFSANAGSNFHGKINSGVCPGGKTANDEHDKLAIESIAVDEITSVEQENKIELFPNPTNGLFVIDFNGKDVSTYKTIVTDVRGNELTVTSKVENSKLQFNISNFSSGMYFLKIINTKNGAIESHKVIKD